MPRTSTVTTRHDGGGDYEIEIFDQPNPKRVVVCAHGGGVRRWDGEKFFYAVAEHYADSAVLLVDQNQLDGDSIRLNPLPILVSRVQGLITLAKQLHPGVPIIVLAHSAGCDVSCALGLDGVNAVVFVTPGTGTPALKLIERYGPDIVLGKTITTSDNLQKTYTPEYYSSIKGRSREDEYAKLAQRFHPVYVFEAENDQTVGDERFAHRDIPFTKYEIIPGAKHNLAGPPLRDFLSRLDQLL
jgi:hypothetical protein